MTSLRLVADKRHNDSKAFLSGIWASIGQEVAIYNRCSNGHVFVLHQCFIRFFYASPNEKEEFLTHIYTYKYIVTWPRALLTSETYCPIYIPSSFVSQFSTQNKASRKGNSVRNREPIQIKASAQRLNLPTGFSHFPPSEICGCHN